MATPTAKDYLDRANQLAKAFQVRDLTPSEICLLTALQLFPEQYGCEIAIFELSKEGVCTINHSFGLSEARKAHWDNGRINLDSPVVESIRKCCVVFVSDRDEFAGRYPDHSVSKDLDNFSKVVSVPILKLGSSIGAMALFGCDTPDDPECNNFLEIIAGLVALKLENTPRALEHRSSLHSGIIGQGLTNREHLVQSMMADGKTNRQIAEELGYSESTIRQDAVSMFQKLGVKDRKSAGGLFDGN